MTSIKYHEAAGDELLNEIGYLELRAKGLGRRFYAEVRRVERLIAQFPESAEEIRPGIRKRVLRQFRYSLIYSREQDSLLILAVAHHSRRQSIGSVVSGVMTRKRRAVPKRRWRPTPRNGAAHRPVSLQRSERRWCDLKYLLSAGPRPSAERRPLTFVRRAICTLGRVRENSCGARHTA